LRNILIEEDDGTGTWVPKIRHDLQHTTDGSSQSWQLGFTEDPDVLESTDLIRHWPGLPISHYRTLWGYAPLKE
jgi:hypothetical protein